MDKITLLIRFLVGMILCSAFVIWGGVPLVMGLLLAVGIGILTTIWGDDFLAWQLRLSRLFVR
jgi:hypothetical protein